MALYLISYDLRKKRDYQKLYDELELFNAIRVLESEWFFRRKGTSASGLRNYFMRFVDADDGLLVCEVSDWASLNALGDPNKL